MRGAEPSGCTWRAAGKPGRSNLWPGRLAGGVSKGMCSVWQGRILGRIAGNTPTHGYLHANPKQASTAHAGRSESAGRFWSKGCAASIKINCSESKSTPELKRRHGGCRLAPNACAADARSRATRSCAEGERNVCASLPDGTSRRVPSCVLQRRKAGHGGGGVLYLPRSKEQSAAQLWANLVLPAVQGTVDTTRLPVYSAGPGA